MSHLLRVGDVVEAADVGDDVGGLERRHVGHVGLDQLEAADAEPAGDLLGGVAVLVAVVVDAANGRGAEAAGDHRVVGVRAEQLDERGLGLLLEHVRQRERDVGREDRRLGPLVGREVPGELLPGRTEERVVVVERPEVGQVDGSRRHAREPSVGRRRVRTCPG